MNRTRIWTVMTFGGAALLAPFAAFAQGEDQGLSASLPPSRYGIELQGGGGYSNFTSSNARSLTGGQGTWNVRAVFGSRLPIGGEVSYLGSAQSVDALGVSSDAYLIGNGGDAVLRVGLPIQTGEVILTPFAVGGIGWTHYGLHNDTLNTSEILGGDDVGAIPMGVGLNATYHGFTADTRLNYRPTFDDDLLGGTSMSTWGVTGNLGVEF